MFLLLAMNHYFWAVSKTESYKQSHATFHITQEAALFSGTLRFNLDPLSRYNDDYIWNCIHNSKVNDYIVKMPNGLNTIIESDGIGLSNGEKQVITCIRGLLSKILKICLERNDWIRRHFSKVQSYFGHLLVNRHLK